MNGLKRLDFKYEIVGQNPVILFGMGKNGLSIAKVIKNVIAFVDNNKYGKTVGGIDCISFVECLDYLYHNSADIILTTGIREMTEQLKTNGINYYEYLDEENNFFYQPFIRAQVDNYLFEQYNDNAYFSSTCKRRQNWFRNDYFEGEDGLNSKLVSLMIEGRIPDINDLLIKKYNKQEDLYEDEKFDHRPAFKLISTLIEQEREKKDVSVCDIGCGNCVFLNELKKCGIKCYGVDSCLRMGVEHNDIEVIHSNAENIEFEDEKFEFVTSMECLEHVIDPFAVCSEAYRILKPNGILFATVPYKNYNDCTTHVRLFDENDAYSVFSKSGFKKIKIMRFPNLYRNIVGNCLLISGLK